MAFGTVSGTFQGNNASIPASFAAALSTGSGAVNIGDIVVCLVTEQTALTVSSVTDSQANTYTAQNAGTLSGANVSGRLFWTRITTAGTLTSVTATCTASADDGVIIAAIIQGPFLASPVDVNLANAPDLTSPFTAPASGTMAQTTEVVVSWCASTGSAAFTGTSPTIIAIQQASAAVVEGVIGTQVPPSTATVTPTYTGTAPTANELGTISFKGAIAELDAASPQPLSESLVKINPRLRPALHQYLAEPPYGFITAVPRFEWRAPWSIPPTQMGPKSLQRGAAHIGGIGVTEPPFAFIKTVPLFQWRQPLSGPVQVKRGLHPSSQDVNAEVYLPPDVRTDWFAPLSEPVRIRTSPTNQQVLAFVPDPIVDTNWSVPLSEPTRAKQRAIADYAYAPLAVSEVVTVDKWFNPLAPPLLAKSGLSPGSQQILAFVAAVDAPYESWFASLSDPVRRIRAAQKVNLFPFTAVATAETTTADKWFVSFTDPVRVKPQLATGSQQSLALVKAAPFPETVTESRWHQPWSEPLRSKPGLSATNQAAFFATTTVETVTADKWFVALSQPPKPKTSVAVASIPALTISTNPIVSFGWAEPLSDPTRRKPEDRDRYSGENEFTAIAVSMEWFAPLNEPVRQKIGLSVTQQRTLAYVITIASTEVSTVDKWFAHLADPVRVKPALLTGRQQFLTWPTQIIIPSLTSWWRPLAEPPKAKAGLLTANQRFATQAADFIPHPNQFLEGWFNWFSEPVRKLAQLNTALQKAWFGPDRNAVQATVTATMAVTEVNGDVALFAIKVLPYNAPATAVVSLVEIGHGASLTSIVEEGDDGSGTSIVES